MSFTNVSNLLICKNTHVSKSAHMNAAKDAGGIDLDKYNLSSVSDADREIPTQGLMNNAGNEVYRVSGIIR